MIARFGRFEADEERFELRRRGQVVPVRRRVLDTILFLARSGGRLVTRHDLIAGPWQGTVVSDAAIGQAIMHARRALEDPELPHEYIVTVRGKGFRWRVEIASVAERHHPPGGWTDGMRLPRSGASPVSSRTTAGSASDAAAAQVEGLQASRRLLNTARRLGDPLRRLDALLACAEHLFALGHTAELERLARQHQRLAATIAHPGHLWFATLLESARRFQAGHVMRAARLLERAQPVGHRALGPIADAIVAAHALNLALELVGKPRRSMLRWAAALATRASTRGAPARPSRLVAAVARLHLGDRRGARRVLDTLDIATLPPDRDLLPALVNLTDLAIACRDGARLDVIHRRLITHAGLRVTRDFADWGDVLYHAARAARGLGLEAERQRLTKLSFRGSRRAGSRPWKLWAAHAHASALLDRSNAADVGRAARLLERTVASARSLDLPALAQAARASLTIARAARPRQS
jgi:DNA-binding winged helix-turn-helix (wHTH) protein